MSLMRHSIQRRAHKERAQPKEREKWGVLEKHKDYSLRAKDFNEKKHRLKILRQKAEERNPDEFHFAMMSSKTNRNGEKAADRGNKALRHDVVKLLKTQDAAYLRTMIQQTKSVRTKLEQELALSQSVGVPQHLAGSSEREPHTSESHVIFVDSLEEQKSWKPSQSAAVAAPTGASASLKDTRAERKRWKKRCESKESLVEALKRRERDLEAAERELELQRARMGNAIGGTTKAGKKFKARERKR